MAIRRITPPMSDLSAFMGSAIEELARDTGFQGSEDYFIWKEARVQCVRHTLPRASIIGVGGFEVDVRLTLDVSWDWFFSADNTLITVDSELFTADDDRPHPVAGRTLIYDGATYRIEKTSLSPGKVHWMLDCGDPNK